MSIQDARRTARESGPRFMLKLADALSPKGAWCGPFAHDTVATWLYVGKCYEPDFNPSQPHSRKFVEKRPATAEECA
jgi:hypothetical protein